MLLKKITSFIFVATFSALPLIGQAFCGFYVSKADTSIYNKASKVVIARKGDKTVITMASDFSENVKEFALVVPVPTIIEKDQVHVTESSIIDHLDAYTTPRLVEYFDCNPCSRQERALMMANASMAKSSSQKGRLELANSVKVEAEYTVGEYDIVLLSSKDSKSLSKWLNSNGYKIPKGAEKVLSSYIKQGMYFFLAKVNYSEYEKGGQKYLRPLQVAFESKKFMLPVRLGTVNANGDQELFIFTITKKGMVEPANYRLIKMPTGINLPVMIKSNFSDVYKDIFNTQVNREKKGIFLEYAWDMGWCDPCAADPLSADELRQLGAFWVKKPKKEINPMTKIAVIPNPVRNVFVTRMHARYDSNTFPDDISFQETTNRKNFQARYILRNHWDGTDKCEGALEYKKHLEQRHKKEAENLSNLTGRNINQIKKEIKKYNEEIKKNKLKWYQEIWRSDSNDKK